MVNLIANRAINAFRQLCWNDIDISSLDEKKLIADLDKDFFGQEANYFAQIVRIISAKKFKLI